MSSLNNFHYITYDNGSNIDGRHEMWWLDAMYGDYYWELINNFSLWTLFFYYRICYNGKISLQISFLLLLKS